MNFQLSKMRKHYWRRFNQTSFRTELHVYFAVPEPFRKEECFEENMYLEESKGYLLFHPTSHPHLPRYRWIQTTQCRSCGENLRDCLEINVAHLSRKRCREGLAASDFQDKQ